MRTLLILLALAGCAASGAQTETRHGDALATALEGRVAGPAERCVPHLGSQALVVVDERTLSYRSDDTLWVNRLRSACPGLRPLDTLIVEVHGSQYCIGDHIRALDPGTTIPGPVCLLGDFVPYRRAE